jgi:hypothetical protein
MTHQFAGIGGGPGHDWLDPEGNPLLLLEPPKP